MATTQAARRAAIDHLMAIERRRARLLADSRAVDVVLLDRTVHTILAHSYVLEREVGVPMLEESRRWIVRSGAPIDTDALLLLHVPHAVAIRRNRGKFPEGEWLMQAAYQQMFCDYFFEQSNTMRYFQQLDAAQPMHTLGLRALDVIRGWLDQSRMPH